MYEKKPVVHKAPDLTKMQAVVIDSRTTIYIALDADPKDALNRYHTRPSYGKH